MKRIIGALGALTLIVIGYNLAPYAVEAVTKTSKHVFTSAVTLAGTNTISGATTISGALTQSGAVTHSGAVTDTSTYTHSGTGARTISTSGATTFSGGDVTLSGADTDLALTGATSDLTVSGGGDVTISSDGVFTHSGTGANTFSSSGTTTFSSGDVVLSGADTDLSLTGATSDIDISGGGAYKIDGNIAIQCDTVTVSTGELLALNATPKVLVAAPGANKFIAVQTVTLALDYNSTAYDGIAAGEDLAIEYVGGAVKVTQDIETTGFLDQSADALRFINGAPQALAAAAAAAPLVPTVNAGIDLSLLVGEIATGNSPLDVRICYSIQPSLLD